MTMLHLEALCAAALWAAFGVGYWLARRTWRRESDRWERAAVEVAEVAQSFYLQMVQHRNALREKGILEAIQDRADAFAYGVGGLLEQKSPDAPPAKT